MVGNTSVDAAELLRFDQLGAAWWDVHGPMRVLHRFNPQRVKWIQQVVAKNQQLDGADPAKPLASIAVLDIGCGGGLLSESMAMCGATVTGVDPGERNIEIARQHAATSNLAIDYRCTSAESLAATGEHFDVVCAMEVIEHVADVDIFMRAAAALTRPGGLLFVATLNRTFRSFALAVIGAEYVLGWVPKGTHQWEKFVTPDELENLFTSVDLEPLERTGVVFEPFREQWNWSRDMSVNFMMAATKPV